MASAGSLIVSPLVPPEFAVKIKGSLFFFFFFFFSFFFNSKTTNSNHSQLDMFTLLSCEFRCVCQDES